MKLRFTVLVGLCALLCMSCGNKKGNYQNIVRPVRVGNVATLGTMQKIYTGVVEAEEYSKLAFKVSGPLVAMNVDAGEKVRKGDVIAAVDPLDYRLKYDASKAAYITAKSQMDRNRKLLSMQAISRQDYEIAEANYVKAKSAYESAENTLDDTRLKAPFDGFVETKYVENYQKVQPGESIIKLVNPDKLEVGFILPETNVGLTKEKMQVSVEFDTYKGKWFKARVKEFVDASPDGSGIPVRLAVDDPSFIRDEYNIYPGFSCRIKVDVFNEEGNGYSVPLSAIFKDMKTNESSVWIYDEATQSVKRRKVVVEHLFGRQNAQVTGGLKPDDVIVIAGVNYIVEGQKVALVNK